MQLYSRFIKSMVLLLMLMDLTACGYKPSSQYARAVVGEKVSTSVIISAEDPENTVVIKDAVDSAIIQIFHASLVDKSESDSHLTFSISEPTYAPIQYNSDGYVISYRANLVLSTFRESKGKSKRYQSTGTYDFSVDPNAVLTDQQRFDAIKYSAQKAISSFVAQISAEGSQKPKE